MQKDQTQKAREMTGRNLDFEEIYRANAIGWEEKAPKRPGESLAFFEAGNLALEPYEIDLLGDLKGKRILQLACSNGDEAVSFALMGAKVTGIDLAPSHIAIAKEKAAALGVQVDLRVGNMMELPKEFGKFDLIYLSWGALCWVPDLQLWFCRLRPHLKRGGKLFIAEHHPVWQVLKVQGENSLTLEKDYFGSGLLPGSPANAIEASLKSEVQRPKMQNFVWNFSSLISHALANRFALETLKELPIAKVYEGLSHPEFMPAVYLAVFKVV